MRNVCQISTSYPTGECASARENGQVIVRGEGRRLVCVYLGRDQETRRRRYLNRTICSGFRAAQHYLNRRLEDCDQGRELDDAGLTLNQYLDRWLELAARPTLRGKSCRDYQALLESQSAFKFTIRRAQTASGRD